MEKCAIRNGDCIVNVYIAHKLDAMWCQLASEGMIYDRQTCVRQMGLKKKVISIWITLDAEVYYTPHSRVDIARFQAVTIKMGIMIGIRPSPVH
jgi:hypothetical protein